MVEDVSKGFTKTMAEPYKENSRALANLNDQFLEIMIELY